MDRRRFCLGLTLAGLGSAAQAQTQAQAAGQPRSVTDLAGRIVRLAGAPRRIVLLEARDLLTMSLLLPDPAARVVGWAAVDRIDSPALQASLARGRRIPEVGKQTPNTISLEGIVALAPDLVVASAYMAPASGDGGFLQRLESLGIPVAFSDVASNSGGADATAPSGPIATMHRHLRLWGDILDARERADAYTAYAGQRLSRVAQRLAGAPAATTYLEVQSTLDDCCWAAGTQVWGELLALAGGKPLPGVTAPWYQKLQREYLLATPFEAYIASGGGWAAGGRPAIGPGIDPARGREGLERLVSRPGFAALPGALRQHTHGIWTGLITMAPLNPLFVEIAAKWLHPDRCADLDPARTLEDINRRFLAQPVAGPLWVSLKE
jgi:iron complex transport system substrate-binding protein